VSHLTGTNVSTLDSVVYKKTALTDVASLEAAVMALDERKRMPLSQLTKAPVFLSTYHVYCGVM